MWSRRSILGGVLALSAAKPCAGGTWPSLNNARRIGRGRLSVVLIPVFDLELIAPEGRWSADKPFGLAITVLRPLQGHLMAKHATDEMGRNPEIPHDRLAQWRASLASILVDVVPGQSAFVLRDEMAATRFYVEGRELGGICDPVFTRAFFDICLGPDSSMPALRRHLLNL